MPTVKLTNDDLPPAYNKSLNETTASAQKPSNSGYPGAAAGTTDGSVPAYPQQYSSICKALLYTMIGCGMLAIIFIMLIAAGAFD
mmetsp:Transcript_20309/g.34663  ORF Transcript_20309/g.34663 Transcript_20309/m.34663 type:complete len:85 (+) Transcript_20309:29-283(+)